MFGLSLSNYMPFETTDVISYPYPMLILSIGFTAYQTPN